MPAPHRGGRPHVAFAVRLGRMLFAALTLAGCSRSSVPAASSVTPFAAALDSFVTRYARLHPVWATSAGIHAQDGRLDDLSPAGIAARRAALQAARAEFAPYAAARLTLDERIDCKVVLARLEAESFELEEARAWQTNPLVYTRLVADALQPLLDNPKAPLGPRLEALAARLRQVPVLLASARLNLRHPSRGEVEAALRQTASLEDLVLEDVPALLDPSVPPSLAAEVQEAATRAATALAGFETWLAGDLMRRAERDFRCGRERFDRYLDAVLKTDWTADAIRTRAGAEAQALRHRMYTVALPLWQRAHPGRRAPQPDDDRGIEAVVLPVLNEIAADHPAPDELLAACTSAVDSLRCFFTRTGLVTPDAGPELRVAWAGRSARGLTIAGLEAPGRLDDERPATFLVLPMPPDWPPAQARSLLREYNRATLQVLAMHEAIPGHYVQLCRARRSPHPVRDLFANPAFVEGWAVYAEDFALASGYGAGDPRLQLAQLKFALRSTLNAVLDVAVHCDGMMEWQALALLREVGFQEEAEAHAKWLRVQFSPGQLCTYFVGLQSIRELEAQDRARLGAAWSRADFAERLLDLGALPGPELGVLLERGGRSSE